MHSPFSLRGRGFTLIELLVVIAIIAILIAYAATSYVEGEKNARDNTRKTNVDTIVSAVEAYYQANQAFPGYIGNEDAVSNPSAYSAGSWANAWGGCFAYVADREQIIYYYHPSDDTSSTTTNLSCGNLKRSTIADAFDPTQYQPSSNWIPGLGPYLDPLPIEGQYSSGLSDPTSVIDPDGTLNSTMLSADNTSMTLMYMHMQGGYAVFTHLENSSPDAAVPIASYNSSTDPRFACTDAPAFCGANNYLQVYNTNIYMVVK